MSRPVRMVAVTPAPNGMRELVPARDRLLLQERQEVGPALRLLRRLGSLHLLHSTAPPPRCQPELVALEGRGILGEERVQREVRGPAARRRTWVGEHSTGLRAPSQGSSPGSSRSPPARAVLLRRSAPAPGPPSSRSSRSSAEATGGARPGQGPPAEPSRAASAIARARLYSPRCSSVRESRDEARRSSGRGEGLRETIQSTHGAEATRTEESTWPPKAATKIFTHLWYAKHAEEAAKFYASLFPDSRVDRVTALRRRRRADPRAR
jgi:hypothetical protein